MTTKQILKKLVAINSVYPNEQQAGEFLYDLLMGLGFSVRKHYISKNRFNLLAKRGSGKKSILFYGHMDTVPPVQTRNWKYQPFRLVENSGKLYGLGAFDMKAGIAATLTALENVDHYVKVFFAVDEENISEGAWRAVKQRSTFFDDVELVISPEPNFSGGLNVVNRGRLGRCIFQINFEGKAVHIAEFRNGVDAIESMNDFTQKLYSKRMALFRKTGCVVQLRKIEAESVGMSVCANASIEVEALIGLGSSIDAVHEWLENLVDGVSVVLKDRKTPYLTSYSFQDFPHSDIVSDVIKKFTGQEMTLTVRNSVGDDNVFAKLGIPVINLGPDGGNAHGTDEYVTSASLETLTKMLRTITTNIGNRANGDLVKASLN